MKHELAHPMERISLWPTYMFRYRYRDWPYDKKKLVDCIREEEKKQEKDIDSNVALGVKSAGLKESKFDFLQKGNEYPILKKYSEFFSEALANVVLHALPSADQRLALPPHIKGVKPVIFESWYHVTNSSGAHGVHCHPGSSWAGIFYVQASECKELNGVNRWLNIDSNRGPGDLGSYWWNTEAVYSFYPEEGTLILFPSWLWHEATPYVGKEDRICIAFNSVIVDTNDKVLIGDA